MARTLKDLITDLVQKQQLDDQDATTLQDKMQAAADAQQAVVTAQQTKAQADQDVTAELAVIDPFVPEGEDFDAGNGFYVTKRGGTVSLRHLADPGAVNVPEPPAAGVAP